MSDSDIAGMTGDPTPSATDIFYGTDSGGTVDKKFNFGDTATYVEGTLDSIVAGDRTSPDTGTPGQIGVDVVLSTGLSGGDTLTGGTDANDDLTLASTTSSTRGNVFVRDALSLMSEDKTHTDAANAYNVVEIPSTRTFTMQAGGLANIGSIMNGFRTANALIFEDDSYLLGGGSAFVNQMAITNASGEARSASVNGFLNAPAFNAVAATFTIAGQGFFDQPSFGIASGGTATISSWVGFTSRMQVNSASATVTTRKGFEVSDSTGAGAVTTAIGVDIAALADATTSIGIRNASTTVHTPLANTNITAVSATIRNDASIVTLTSNAAYTLTSAPTIANGQDGQVLRIINVDTTDAITIQDQGTLASSNLRLSATTIALGPRDSITLVYSSTVGDWVQVAQVNVV